MKRQTQSKKRVLLAIIGAVLVIAAFGVSMHFLEKVWGDGADKGKIEDTEEALQTLYFDDDEYQITHNLETYLLIGTDDSGNVEAEGTKEYRGQMADFLLLLVMDKTDSTYGFLQLDRNTMTDVPYLDTEGHGDEEMFEQICVAHWYGGSPEMGCDNTVSTVSELLGGINIDGYYSIHMSDMGILNHAVGGVEVTIEDDMTMVDPAMKKGTTLTLSDEQAEKFVRARMEVGDGDNASRMVRQDQFMKGFQAKAMDRIGSDPAFINDLYMALEEDAVTDVPENRISVITNQIYKGQSLGTLTYEGETRRGDTLDDGVMHEEFYADTDSIAQVMSKLCGIDEEHIILYDDTDDEAYDEADDEDEATGEDE